MAVDRTALGSAEKEYVALLQLQRRLLTQLERVADELDAPATLDLLGAIRRGMGSRAVDRIGEITKSVEEAIRLLKLFGSELGGELSHPDEEIRTNIVAGLPAPLARFMAERRRAPECKITVDHDPVRGWIIRWKEYTEFGTVRGWGQFCERPYAWLDD